MRQRDMIDTPATRLAELSGISVSEVEKRVKELTGGRTISKIRRPSMNRKQRRIMEAQERKRTLVIGDKL